MNSLVIPILLIVLAPIIGGLVYGIERKVKARMQRRIGPPILQPFYDFLKLADKRVMIVHSAHAFFGIMHFVSLCLRCKTIRQRAARQWIVFRSKQNSKI